MRDEAPLQPLTAEAPPIAVRQRRLRWPPPSLWAALLGLSLCLLVYQTPARHQVVVGAPDAAVVAGFGDPETNDRGGFRWTSGDASVAVPPLGTPLHLRIDATGWRPNDIDPPILTVLLDGQVVARWQTTRAPAIYEITTPRLLQTAGTRLELRSDTFVPGARDRRTLGVAVSTIELGSPEGVWRPIAPPLLPLLLSVLLPVLLLRGIRHLRMPAWPALALTFVILLAVATAAANDLAAWLMQSPTALMLIAGLAGLAAVSPALIASAAPAVRGALGAMRLGLLPAWPEWEGIAGTTVTAQRARAIRWAVAGTALAVLLLHLASGLTPSETEAWQSTLWGVSYVWRLPSWVVLGLAAPVIALAVPAVSRFAWRALVAIGRRPARVVERTNPYLIALLAGSAALPLFWLLRSGTDRYGDALELQRKIADEGALWREREPLDFFLHAQLYRVVQPLTGWDVPTVYALLSCLAGGLFVATICILVALLARRRLDRVLAAALILTAGFMQLFFGYLESYTLMTATLGIYLLASLLCLAGRVGVAVPAIVLACAALLHPIALTVAPSIGLLLLDRWRRRGFGVGQAARVFGAALAGFAVPVLLLIALFLANGYTAERWEIARHQFGGGDKRTFKPLTTLSSPREYYTLVSLDHVRAVVNQQLLVAPFGWPLVVALLAAARPRGLWRDARFAFLLLAAATTLTFSALWNPDLGARQDWDLLAIGALPVMTLSAYLVVTVVPRGADRRYCGLLLIGASLYHTLLWVLVNSRLLGPWVGP